MLPRRKQPPFGTLCATALVAILGACAAPAQDIRPRTLAVIEIVDRIDARVLPIHWHDGRRYVVGKPGNEYAIRIRNTSGGRVLAVMSVDGINIISGDTASQQQSGYVLAPYESADIAGWRKSLSRTAAFYFTALPDSYAARSGRPENAGVIGVALFRERVRAIAREQIQRKDAARAEASPTQAPASNGAVGAAAQAAGEPLGTGHGRNEASYASYTQFDRANDTPEETVAIYYDSYENLLAQGVPVGSPRVARLRPDPFPYAGRFVSDPSLP